MEKQIHRNNWNKAKGIYDGTFMPENPKVLLKQGWHNAKSPNNKTTDQQEYINNKTSEKVEYHDGKFNKSGSWDGRHINCLEKTDSGRYKKRLDRYGNIYEDKNFYNTNTHLAPFDKDYKQDYGNPLKGDDFSKKTGKDKTKFK